MSSPPLADVVGATYRRRAGTATPDDLGVLEEVALQPLTGGMNNQLYRLRHDGGDLCLKLHRVDHRHRADREWLTLTVLAGRGHPRAPHPVWRSDRDDHPAIVMTLAAGTPLGGACLQPPQLDAVVAALSDLYSITPADVIDPVPEAATPATAMLQRLHDTWTALTATADPRQRQLVDLWQRWSSSPDPEVVHTPAPQQVLGRGDPSLANVLWDDTGLTLLDFEYSGWTDPAYELADLIEHPQSRGTPDHAWSVFVDRFELDSDARVRHRAARRMLALFWLARWRPDDDRFAAQSDRTQHLLDHLP